jgi:hypothetical protein
MKNWIIALLILLSSILKAQTNTDFLKEINRDIWQPFTEAYATLDVEKYKNLQSEDFIRAEGNDKRLPTFQNYFTNMGIWFSELKQYSRKLSIGFRFTERFANERVASERGIYELRMFDSKGNEMWKG